MRKPESYPFFRIAKEFDIPYAEVLAYADVLRRNGTVFTKASPKDTDTVIRWINNGRRYEAAAAEIAAATDEQNAVRRGYINWKTGESTRKLVFANLDASLENGYFDEGEQLHGATAEDIAHDLIAYAEDCNEYTVKTLVRYVNEWQGLEGNPANG